jgi:hypothetical protein
LAEAWDAEHTRLEPVLEASVERLGRVPEMFAEIIDIFNEALNVEQQCDRLNLNAVAGEHRRLRFNTDAKRVISTTVLPAFTNRHDTLWPIKQHNSLATMFASSSGFLPDASTTADWWRAGQQKREEDAERAIHEAEENERGREEFYKRGF